MSELVVISLPGVQIDDTGALLRVLLVPRLTGPGTDLGAYGLTDWPAVLASATTMQVAVRTSAGQDLTPEDVTLRHTASSAVWRAFFDGIDVTPFSGTPTYPMAEVTPTASHADQIDTAYAAATQSVEDPHQVEQQLDQLALAPPPPTPDPAAPIPTEEPPEFHRLVSRLRQHPFVLRHLGLIVDVTVPRHLIDQAGTSGVIRVGWAQPPAGFDQLITPATAFVVRQGRFLAAPADEALGAPPVAAVIVDGMVDLRRTTPTPVVDRVTGATSVQDVPD